MIIYHFAIGPLASGILCRPVGQINTDRSKDTAILKMKYFKTGDEEVTQTVQDIAKERGIPAAQVALAWLLSKQGVASPIIGATKPHHISDAVASLQVKLTTEEIKRIEENYKPHAISGHN